MLKDVSLEVQGGEIVTIIGANGAGKSTLMGALAGIYPISSGKITYLGQDITNKPPQGVVALGLSLIPERREIFDALSVGDNLILGSYHRYSRDRKRIKSDLAEILELFPALQGKEKRLAGGLSGGEQQMLAIARGLMARPKLLCLDEPSIGLAPLIVQEIFQIIQRLKQSGTTVLLVEQNAQLALTHADRAYVLERGEIVLTGTDLLHDPRVQAAYLGQRKTGQGNS